MKNKTIIIDKKIIYKYKKKKYFENEREIKNLNIIEIASENQ